MTTPNTPANGGQILTDEPLPCPFCGGAAKTLQYNGTTQATCSGKYVECAGADVMSPVSMWNRRASLSDPAIPTDHDEAVTLLSAVFDAWESGDDCHEEGDPSGTYLGKCFPLDDDVFKRCCDLLNRLNPPRNAAPAIPTVDRNAVLEEAAKACEEFDMHGMALTIRELKSVEPAGVPATARQSICHDTRFMDALDGYMDAVTNEPRNTDRRVKQRLEIFAAADAWRATPATVKTAEVDEK